jgi:hypothetical protein
LSGGHKGQRLARWQGRRGQIHQAPLTEDGSRVELFSRKWYGYLPGDPRPIPLCTNKTAAEQMLTVRVRLKGYEGELRQVTVIDPGHE